ncbi:MAG: hypothetical protein ACREHD_29845, partial [Pirellulales bacterium]
CRSVPKEMRGHGNRFVAAHATNSRIESAARKRRPPCHLGRREQVKQAAISFNMHTDFISARSTLDTDERRQQPAQKENSSTHVHRS